MMIKISGLERVDATRTGEVTSFIAQYDKQKKAGAFSLSPAYPSFIGIFL
jgi:hypothetical protein